MSRYATQQIMDGLRGLGDPLASEPYAQALDIVATVALITGREDIADRVHALSVEVAKLPEPPRRRCSHG